MMLWTFLVVMCSAHCSAFIFHRSNDVEQHRDDGSRPNILLIMADDMGWGDVGANWPDTLDTPYLDSLAKKGLRLTDFHSGTSVCTPSRAALLTGRLGLRTGVVKNFGVESVGGIPENETTIAEVLQRVGYRTAMVGKWHLGLLHKHHPLDKGFQSYEGIPYSNDMGCADPAGVNIPQCASCTSGNDVNTTVPGCFDDLALPLFEDRTILHQPVKLSNVSSLYADFAEDFINNSSSSDAPFFLYAALSHMHVPLAHARAFDNITGRGVFADSLREMDWLVEKLVSAATRGNRNTLVWFISDNGPWAVKCDLAGSGGPFTGDWQRSPTGGGGGCAMKMTVWEAGHRVPSIVYWPGRVKAGAVSDALVSALDILPTLASVAKASLPRYRSFDGENMLPVILGTKRKGHEVLFHPNSGAAGPDGAIGAVRVGPYKAVYYSGGCPDCSGRAAPVQEHFDKPLVFHLTSDPAESSPLKTSSWDYQYTVWRARQAMFSVHASIRADNTSTVDYSTKKSARACCNPDSPICRCTWD